MAILAAGLMSSMVLLSASSPPPLLTVSQLWRLDGDAVLTVSGVLVSLRSYDSGTEVMVLSDSSSPVTVSVVCTPGPGQPPGGFVHTGDLLSVSGECTFQDGVPSVYCMYGGVRLLQTAEDVVTVGMLCASWELFEGDHISLHGVSVSDGAGALRLYDADGERSIAMSLDPGVQPMEGEVLVSCTLVLDADVLSLVLQVDALAPGT